MFYNDELNPEHSLIDYYNNQVAQGGKGFDEATENQVKTLTSKASAAIQEANDHHNKGKYDLSHSTLLAAVGHIKSAARVIDGGRTGTRFGSASALASNAEDVLGKYKATYGK